MCRLRNIAMRDYQESVTTGQTDRQTNRQTNRQTPDKVIPMCRYASQATQKFPKHLNVYYMHSPPYKYGYYTKLMWIKLFTA